MVFGPWSLVSGPLSVDAARFLRHKAKPAPAAPTAAAAPTVAPTMAPTFVPPPEVSGSLVGLGCPVDDDELDELDEPDEPDEPDEDGEEDEVGVEVEVDELVDVGLVLVVG